MPLIQFPFIEVPKELHALVGERPFIVVSVISSAFLRLALA